MYSFKSSPLIQQTNRPRRVSRKQSGLCENKNVSKQSQYKIPNPFLSSQQQNYLPNQLKQHIQQMQYISPASVSTINFPLTLQSQRRSSNFTKHLHLMKNAVRSQQQKFNYMMNKKHNKQFQQFEQNQMIDEKYQDRISISDLDNLSIEMMDQCMNDIDYRDLDYDNLGIFNYQQENQQNQIIFYSHTQIPDSYDTNNHQYQQYFNN